MSNPDNTIIFVATYNEFGSIEQLTEKLLALPGNSDLLFVDDSSTDGTTGYLLSKAAANSRVHVIVRPGKFGVGSAHKLGWLYARVNGYSRIVTMDADLSHTPRDVPRLLAALDAGADVAVGSRFCRGGRTDYHGWRRFLSSAANILASQILRLSVTEHTTSLRAARLDRVPPGLVESIDANGYSFFMTCITRMVRQGLSITEVPIHFHDRKRGSSKMPRAAILEAALSLMRLGVVRDRVDPLGIPPRSKLECPVCGDPCRVFVSRADLVCLKCFGTCCNSSSRPFGTS